MAKPKIYMLGCGGTVAGKAASDQELLGYKAGEIGIGELIRRMPELGAIADIQGEQVCNIDSTDMTEQIWLQLAQRVQELADAPDTAGIVIAHGTDTMEETAYFLHLTVHTAKPIVFTGAIRPATALSADGPLNLLNAVHLAASPGAGAYGVLIAMNDQINNARDVSKTNTSHVDAFKSWELGFAGCFQNGMPRFYQASTRIHTDRSRFSCEEIGGLPPVWIIYCHVGMTADVVQLAVQKGVRGLVLAGLGHGNIPAPVLQALQHFCREQKLVVVRSSRTGGGIVSPVAADAGWPIIAGDNLSCQKAKILLQLALQQTNETENIQKIFDTY